MPVHVVAFDLMDTLLRDPYREAIAAGFGRPLAEVARRGLPPVWPVFEAGAMSEDAYWQAYRDAGHDVDPAAFHAARRAGYRWLDGTRELLHELLDANVRVVVASNYPHWIAEVAEDWLPDGLERVLSSHELRVRKPDPGFYAGVLGAVGVAPARVLFVDDRDVNVVAAANAGMLGHRFVDASTLRAALVAHRLLA